MATPSLDITSFVGKLLEQDDVDLLREGVRVLAQAVMEAEVTGQIGAGPYERIPAARRPTATATASRRWDTRVGTIELAIPEVTAGAYFPSPARAAPAGRAGPARGRPRGLRAGGLHAPGRRPRAGARDRRHQPQRGLPDLQRARRPRCRPSAAARSRPSARTCGSTRPTSRSARPVGWSRWRRWSRSASRPRASARCWEPRPGRARASSSGRRSSARSSSVASAACAS